MSEQLTGLTLKSMVTENGTLELFLKEEAVPEPGENEVIIKVEATPINPSDQATLIFPADVTTGETKGEGKETVYSAKLKTEVKKMVQPRLGKALRAGNEGAGTVIKAGSGEAAQSLLNKTVAVMDGALYCQYRKVNALQCLELNEGTSPIQGASCFVNPLTALGMTETMRMDRFKSLIHTAAASNLGQMLNRVCIEDGIDLINIVRKQDQLELLKSQGAKYVFNSSDDDFLRQLTDAIEETEAYLVFDAIGGGDLVSRILSCMENAAARSTVLRGPYGSNVFKQAYIYGGLDSSPTIIKRNFGFSWGISAWLLTPFLEKAGLETSIAMRQRVADEISSTFASHYAKEISLEEALQADIVASYSKQATGEKYLIRPFK